MKSIKKLIFVMAVLAAVFGFVACSDDDDDDDDDGPSKVAVYTGEGFGDLSYEITFYDDGTFKNVFTIEVGSGTAATGTYTGDVTKDTSDDNRVTFTTKTVGEYDWDAGKFTEDSIRDHAKMMLELWGKEVTDAAVDEFIEERYIDRPISIEDGSFVHNGVTYTIKK